MSYIRMSMVVDCTGWRSNATTDQSSSMTHTYICSGCTIYKCIYRCYGGRCYVLALHKEVPIATFVHTMKNAFPLAKKWEYGLTICEERIICSRDMGTYRSTYCTVVYARRMCVCVVRVSHTVSCNVTGQAYLDNLIVIDLCHSATHTHARMHEHTQHSHGQKERQKEKEKKRREGRQERGEGERKRRREEGKEERERRGRV